MSPLLSLFCIKDLKADNHTAPFNSQNIATAIREFTELVNTDGNPYNKYPEDYSLWVLGNFDRNDADLTKTALKKVCEAKEIKDA